MEVKYGGVLTREPNRKPSPNSCDLDYAPAIIILKGFLKIQVYIESALGCRDYAAVGFEVFSADPKEFSMVQ